MAGVNKVHLVGHLGKDPELRYSQSGVAVANATLATSERRKVDGDWQDYTEWHRLVFFGKTAEALGRYCKKGKQLYVEGSLQTRKWQDKEGQDRWTTEVKVNQMVMLGSKDGAQESHDSDWSKGTKSEPSGAPSGAPSTAQGGGYQDDDDDSLPF